MISIYLELQGCVSASRRHRESSAMYLLEKIGVAGVPGEAFFSSSAAASFIRFSYAKTDLELDKACRRLTQVGF